MSHFVALRRSFSTAIRKCLRFEISSRQAPPMSKEKPVERIVNRHPFKSQMEWSRTVEQEKQAARDRAVEVAKKLGVRMLVKEKEAEIKAQEEASKVAAVYSLPKGHQPHPKYAARRLAENIMSLSERDMVPRRQRDSKIWRIQNQPKEEMPVRLDDLYYEHVDRTQFEYPQTWVEYPAVRRMLNAQNEAVEPADEALPPIQKRRNPRHFKHTPDPPAKPAVHPPAAPLTPLSYARNNVLKQYVELQKFQDNIVKQNNKLFPPPEHD